MPRISISYRRADTAGITGRIFDRLKQHYGPDSVFIDIDSMRMGRNYKKQIDAALSTTDVLLIIVGRQWLGPRPQGSNRILDENDPVRLEVEAATRYERLVIPVLVDGSTMPDISQLPESLGEFPYLQAAEIDSGRFFDRDISGLIRSLDDEIDLLRQAETQPGVQTGVDEERREADAPAKEQARLEIEPREAKAHANEQPLGTSQRLFLPCGALLVVTSLVLVVGRNIAGYNGDESDYIRACVLIDFVVAAILAVTGTLARPARLFYLLWLDAGANAAFAICLLPNLFDFREQTALFAGLFYLTWIASASVRAWTAWKNEGALRSIVLVTSAALFVCGILLITHVLNVLYWFVAFGAYDGACGLGYVAIALALRGGRNAASSET